MESSTREFWINLAASVAKSKFNAPSSLGNLVSKTIRSSGGRDRSAVRKISYSSRGPNSVTCTLSGQLKMVHHSSFKRSDTQKDSSGTHTYVAYAEGEA